MKLPGFDIDLKNNSHGPVTCLGMEFENDEDRRDHFTELLREKLKNPEFREIEGFPIGEDEDILALSDPPYYTACPNPFLDQIVIDSANNKKRKQDSKTAFSDDLTGSKHGRIYNVHTYHTKVPPEAIAPLIKHYTEPGDIIIDPFAGTGMTAVAVAQCNEENISEQPRRVILNELSPIASYIASHYSHSIERPNNLIKSLEEKIESTFEDCKKYYRTLHNGWPANIARSQKVKPQNRDCSPDEYGVIIYTVWSDVYVCPECGEEFTYWEEAVKLFHCQVLDVFKCPTCSVNLCKEPKFVKKGPAQLIERATETWFDPIVKSALLRHKRKPVLISYEYGGKRYEKYPSQEDFDIISSSDTLYSDVEAVPMIFKGEAWGDTWRAGVHLGVTHVHHFYTNRNLYAMALLRNKLKNRKLWFALTSAALRLSKMNRYMPQHRGNRSREVVGPLSGTLYIPAIGIEVNPIQYIKSKIKDIKKLWEHSFPNNSFCSTQSATNISQLPDSSIDYVFMDPPFGANLFYSELNFLWEWWIGLFSNRSPEAIISPAMNKSIYDYKSLMGLALKECVRVLKSGAWLTMEFHNSKNVVWTAINEALQAAGLVVADVRVMDKKKGTTKQLTFSNSVKQDLIISAYKPNGGLEERFIQKAGTEDGAWEFVRTHLSQLPVFVSKGQKLEILAERQNFLLYDRMVAFHVQRGVSIPLSSAEFYNGLIQRFSERDGMFFLPDQVVEYDKKRITVREIEQLSLFITDENSARQWLRERLGDKPQSFQELHPQFIRDIGGWSKNEKSLELSTLLEQNFLCFLGEGNVPEQIHAYLSSNWKDMRNLEKDDPVLKAKAKDRWYVPDPNKAGDLEKLREKVLLKEFEEYKQAKKKLKVFRLEAVRAGFKKAWQDKDYAVIVKVAEKIPNKILEEDPKLLMWYDQSVTRIGD